MLFQRCSAFHIATSLRSTWQSTSRCFTYLASAHVRVSSLAFLCVFVVCCADQSHSKPTTHHIENKDELQGVEELEEKHQELIDKMIESHTHHKQAVVSPPSSLLFSLSFADPTRRSESAALCLLHRSELPKLSDKWKDMAGKRKTSWSEEQVEDSTKDGEMWKTMVEEAGEAADGETKTKKKPAAKAKAKKQAEEDEEEGEEAEGGEEEGEKEEAEAEVAAKPKKGKGGKQAQKKKATPAKRKKSAKDSEATEKEEKAESEEKEAAEDRVEEKEDRMEKKEHTEETAANGAAGDEEDEKAEAAPKKKAGKAAGKQTQASKKQKS